MRGAEVSEIEKVSERQPLLFAQCDGAKHPRKVQRRLGGDAGHSAIHRQLRPRYPGGAAPATDRSNVILRLSDNRDQLDPTSDHMIGSHANSSASTPTLP